MTARRRGYHPGNPDEHDPEQADPDEVRAVEGHVVEGREGELTAEQQEDLAKLEGYYGKVLGDLDREMQEAHKVHDASEKRMADVEAQKAQIDAEYAERKAAIETPPPPPEGEEPTVQVRPSRWSPTAFTERREPKPTPPTPDPRPRPGQPQPLELTS